MFQKIIRYIDSFFWETKITTIITTVRRKTPSTPVSQPYTVHGFRLMVNNDYPEVICVENQFVEYTSDDFIYIDGTSPIPIPGIVRNRRSLKTSEGEYDRIRRPVHLDTYSLVSIAAGERKFAFIDGEPLSRTDTIKGITKKKAVVTIATCREKIERFNIEQVLSVYKDLNISFSKNADWIYFNIIDSHSNHIRFYQEWINQFDSVEQCVKMAYIISRSLILDMSGAGIDTSDYDETDFARTLMKTFLQVFHKDIFTDNQTKVSFAA